MDYHSSRNLSLSNIELWERAEGLRQRIRAMDHKDRAHSWEMQEVFYLMPVFMHRLEMMDPAVKDWAAKRPALVRE
jgi:hypothetical protein